MAGSFEMDITRFITKTKLRAEQVISKIAFDMCSQIQRRTPRDTHRAVTGWQISINSPSGFNPGPGNYPDPPPPKVPAFKLGDSIWYVNNVHYVPYLEYGTAPYGFSKQAPAGMLRVTITEYQAYVARAVASLGG